MTPWFGQVPSINLTQQVRPHQEEGGGGRGEGRGGAGDGGDGEGEEGGGEGRGEGRGGGGGAEFHVRSVQNSPGREVITRSFLPARSSCRIREKCVILNYFWPGFR